jgi:hypothetical protein
MSKSLEVRESHESPSVFKLPRLLDSLEAGPLSEFPTVYALFEAHHMSKMIRLCELLQAQYIYMYIRGSSTK